MHPPVCFILHHLPWILYNEPTYSQSGSPHCSPPWSRPSSLPGFLPLRWLHPSSTLAWLPVYPGNLSGQPSIPPLSIDDDDKHKQNLSIPANTHTFGYNLEVNLALKSMFPRIERELMGEQKASVIQWKVHYITLRYTDYTAWSKEWGLDTDNIGLKNHRCPNCPSSFVS